MSIEHIRTRDDYVNAATRDNTRQSYNSALRHYEVEWGGFLPGTADGVSRYLAHYAPSLAVSTLRQRLAAIANWHREHGFPDPTKAPLVKKTLKGISEAHPYQERQAKPLRLEQLSQAVSWLDAQIADARLRNDRASELRCRRDKSLLLLGFWRGFRTDELSRLRVEYVEVVPGEGMVCFLPRSKGDRQNKGTRHKTPALSQLCPVDAYLDWVSAAQLTEGPVYRAIDRWGHVGDTGLHTDSIAPLLRQILQGAGLEGSDHYSGHSLRRGFAQWASTHGWEIQALMRHVGWKNVQSAMRYMDEADASVQNRIEAVLTALALKRPAVLQRPDETSA
jgi:integrase